MMPSNIWQAVDKVTTEVITERDEEDNVEEMLKPLLTSLCKVPELSSRNS